MRRLVIPCLCLLALAAWLVALGAPRVDRPPLEVTYIANEGFLLKAGEDKVIIDEIGRASCRERV